MRLKEFITVWMALPLLAACQWNSEMDEVLQQQELSPLTLQAVLGETVTRTGTGVQTSTFGTGNVDVWIKNYRQGTGAKQTSYTKYSCTVSGSTLTPSSQLNYPGDGTSVTTYAVKPSGTTSGTFTVKPDQTAESNYLASDLIYCAEKAYNQVTGPISMHFEHLLTKIVVNVASADGKLNATQLAGTTVRLNAKRSCSFSFPTASTVTVSGSASTVTLSSGGAAIIPPQTVNSGTAFITVSDNGAEDTSYVLDANQTFEAGKQYTFTVLVLGKSIVTATCTVSSWDGENMTTQTGYL